MRPNDWELVVGTGASRVKRGMNLWFATGLEVQLPAVRSQSQFVQLIPICPNSMRKRYIEIEEFRNKKKKNVRGHNQIRIVLDE